MMRYATVLAIAALLVGAGCKKSEKEKGEAQSPKESSESAEQGAAAQEGEKEEDEHPGDEHPGDEHPGDETETKDSYSADHIKKAMKSHIEEQTDDSGIFEIGDEKQDEKLALKFMEIHDPVRRVEGKGYFACTDFHVDGEKEKVYDLDFWLKPQGAELEVTKTRIHKHPVKEDGEWKKKARFTYKDDEPVKVE